jgi:hypothetical protein
VWELPLSDHGRVKVLDDARFLTLDCYIPSFHRFLITHSDVSFPTAKELEQPPGEMTWMRLIAASW